MPERAPSAVAAAAEFAVERRTHRGYPVAEREDARVAAVDSLDRGRLLEAGALDDLATAVTNAVDADAATVGLLGEYRLHVVGRSDGALPTAVDRARSLSTYTVLEDGVHAVPDIAADPRFEADSLALEYGLRSYAGVAVRVDGAAVGTLSTFRRERGPPAAADRETLRLLGGVAGDLLEGSSPAPATRGGRARPTRGRRRADCLNRRRTPAAAPQPSRPVSAGRADARRN
ncbi:GAF domain-containing protein [Halobaculum litoreum]|uniref:GAF domain-containing protein n=1 Tax=Halobaculum litoreum TaxID=3031998 RepID=UPI0024C292C3|nr:GAF domain-containing protein [Halobaculum sp. DT92]